MSRSKAIAEPGIVGLCDGGLDSHFPLSFPPLAAPLDQGKREIENITTRKYSNNSSLFKKSPVSSLLKDLY